MALILLGVSGDAAPAAPPGAAGPQAAAEGPRSRLGPLGDRPRSGGKVTLRIRTPLVRIGLSGDARAVTLDSAGGLYIVDRESGRDVWKHLHRGLVRVVLDREAAPEAPSVFQVQVASLSDPAEAEELRLRLEQETGESAVVTHNPDRNAWRVRVGQRASREELVRLEERLRELGFNETWVVEEPAPGGREPRLRLVDEDYNDMPTSGKGLLILPAAEGRPVRVNDLPYRGVIEVRLTRARQLKAINVLNLEEYLKGVVPKELGPSVYPELEALKAQAVAARTYLEANRNQFSEDGYDICDSARCQVYGGLSAEHPLSDFAVEQTTGQILTYEGRPINAMYTSTCGGHTEDVRNVFREMKGPYLKPVKCYPDEETLALSRRTLQGTLPATPVLLPGGDRIDESLAMLEVLGVVTPEEVSAGTPAEAMSSALPAAQAGAWATRALAAAGKRPPEGFEPSREIPDLASLATYLVDAFGWSERLALLLDPLDLPDYLAPGPREAAPPEALPAYAYLIKEEILPRPRAGLEAGPRADGPRAPATRAHLAYALDRMLRRYDASGLIPAKHRGFQADRIGLQEEGAVTFRPLAGRLHLLVRSEGATVSVAEHAFRDGDNLEYHLSRTGAVDLMVVRANQRSGSDDRYSSVYSWEVRIPREELETRIRSRASIGRLVDLAPGRRGPSGRLIDLTVVGSAGRFKFHGFDIERLLGLRESLFLVDRQYDEDGRVRTFVFAGKGWGHGVGLCQVGAYGMALRGRTHEEILKRYYTGVTLETIAPR